MYNKTESIKQILKYSMYSDVKNMNKRNSQVTSKTDNANITSS